MQCNAGRVPTRPAALRRAAAIALALLAAGAGPAGAQEPLFLRIRPSPGGDAGDAAREALWARRQAHARAVIASVCTGCLGAWTSPVAAPPVPPPERVAAAGLETDPGSGASEPASDPSIPERRE